MTPVAVLGISYKTSSVDLRGRLAVSVDLLTPALGEVLSFGAQEGVILSTCNRVEFYWSGENSQQVARELRQKWQAKTGTSLADELYYLEGRSAVRHLFRVAAGLDSMVMGEPQILGQVKSAYQAALHSGTTGRSLNRIFQRALQAGKRVRTETKIACGITSVASAAVVLSERIFGDLSQTGVMILGAGTMAEAAAKHLLSCKTRALWVANRTHSRAEELARTLGAEALPWDQALARTSEMDILLCSTSAETYVITPELVQGWKKVRHGRPLFIIDISVPRNVDPAVQKLENIYVYDIDDLKKVVADQSELKQLEAQKAEALIDCLVKDTLERSAAAHPSLTPSWNSTYA